MLIETSNEARSGHPRDESILAISFLITTINVVFALRANASLSTVLIVVAYFLLPAVVLFIANSKPNKPCRADILALALMFLPPFILGKRFGGKADLPLVVFSAVVEAWYFWGVYRKMSGLAFFPKTSWRNAAWTFGTLAVLWLLLVWLALLVGFPVARPETLEASKTWFGLATLTLKSCFAQQFLFLWIRKALVTALVEELLFRGLVQNFLEKRFGKTAWTLLLASMIFGLSHLNQGPVSVLNPGTWNWPYVFMSAVAGLGFGLVYRKTESLAPSNAVHTTIDSIARTLFILK